jgi:hypothetical protein
MSVPYAKLPAWVDYGLIPLINLSSPFWLPDWWCWRLVKARCARQRC